MMDYTCPMCKESAIEDKNETRLPMSLYGTCHHCKGLLTIVKDYERSTNEEPVFTLVCQSSK